MSWVANEFQSRVDGSQDSWSEHEAVRAINESDEGGMSGPGDERVSIGIPGMDQAQQSKILRGTAGLGIVTPQMIEERAREIACSDGREQPNDLDRTRAHEELTGTTPASETPPIREDPGRDWEIPLVSSGEKAPTVRPEDEGNIPEKLIREGVEEADYDQRLSSNQTGES